jgi:hypothetical protein
VGARLAKNPDDRKNMQKDYDHVKKENINRLVAKIKKYFSSQKNKQPA